MGVRLSDMTSRVKETTLKYDGEEVAFAYRPNAFTMEVSDQINVASEKDDMGTVSALLEPLVEWWDVLDDEDQRIPPTAENMRRFPLSFLLKIMDAITEDASPEQEG